MESIHDETAQRIIGLDFPRCDRLQGIGSVELKMDQRTGRIYDDRAEPQVVGAEHQATYAGVNFPDTVR